MKKINLIVSLAFSFLWACEKKDPNIENQEELITTFTYTLKAISGGETVTFKFTDLDGDGGKPPVIISGALKQNTTYTGTVKLSNDSVSPSEDIGAEVLNESDDHQIFYSLSTKNIVINYTDKDTKGNPLGINTSLKTGSIENGMLKITLKHKPNKSGIGVNNGNIENAGGETDVEVNFPVSVQ